MHAYSNQDGDTPLALALKNGNQEAAIKVLESELFDPQKENSTNICSLTSQLDSRHYFYNDLKTLLEENKLIA